MTGGASVLAAEHVTDLPLTCRNRPHVRGSVFCESAL